MLTSDDMIASSAEDVAIKAPGDAVAMRSATKGSVLSNVPAFIASTSSRIGSTPMTRLPAAAKHVASVCPIFPSPKTEIFIPPLCYTDGEAASHNIQATWGRQRRLH